MRVLREHAYLRLDPCAHCGGPGGTIDHIVPAARSGDSTSDTLTGSCDACNTAKGAWALPPFMLPRAWSAPAQERHDNRARGVDTTRLYDSTYTQHQRAQEVAEPGSRTSEQRRTAPARATGAAA